MDSSKIIKDNMFKINEKNYHNYSVVHFKVDKDNEKALKRIKGDYFSINFDYISLHKQEMALKKEVMKILNVFFKNENPARPLIIGLGNSSVLCDSLGIKTTNKVMATNHFTDFLNIPKVAIFNPEVTEKTGISSFGLIEMVVKKLKPTVIIMIDSLATTNEVYLNNCIEINNTGIIPGSAIKDNKNELFRNKYRSIDVLLIDDIQFIGGKDRVQEEFFHTFNTLYEEHKQIVLSSDKQPKEIPFLEDRLKSRFEWGLLADISNPSYETRLAILRKKAQDESLVIDDNILSNVANRIDSNIRELEGVFNKIVARASLTHSPITIELAENIINEFKYEKEKVISCDFIKETVAKYFSINKDDLSSNKRSNDISFPRQIAMYLCREVANMSYPQIGTDFGGRDHSTVMHGCKKIEKEVKEKTNTKLIVDSVKNIIVDDKQ